MENQFFVDSEYLSPAALEKKHRLETDPSSRMNHMEYLPGMEIIESDVCQQVMSQMNSFDYSIYTARDVRAALDHETCSVEDFRHSYRLRQSLFWKKWHRKPAWRQASTLAIPFTYLPLCTLPIIARTTAFTAASTATTISTA